MQFVVEIPDRCVTEDTCFTEWVQNAGKDFRFNILPKGHGRLVDYDEMKKIAIEYGRFTKSTLSYIKPKVLIEADGGDAE